MEFSGFSIRTEKLRKSFNGFVAVDDLTVAIRPGEIFGLLGPNGAGKTTSIRMITGLLKPDSGEVVIDGIPAGGTESRFRVGICPQEIVLWNNLTCTEQLVFMAAMYKVPGKIARKRAAELLERLGLTEKRNKLARTLSGGMQRRMNILMALMHDPPVVVLDEPEAGLDPQSRIMVREFIRSMARNKTVIFTTHNMDEADRVCDRVAIIDHGKLLVTDTPDGLKSGTGKGDKLEINTDRPVTDTKQLETLAKVTCDPDNRLILHAMGIVERIPSILHELSNQGVAVKGIILSENTLEDVFISLTGRKLRD